METEREAEAKWKWVNKLGIGNLARILVVGLPIGYTLGQYELDNHDRLVAIEINMRAMVANGGMTQSAAADNLKAEAGQRDILIAGLSKRVDTLESQRENDAHYVGDLAAKIEGIRSQGDATLAGVNELRQWLMLRPHKG